MGRERRREEDRGLPDVITVPNRPGIVAVRLFSFPGSLRIPRFPRWDRARAVVRMPCRPHSIAVLIMMSMPALARRHAPGTIGTRLRCGDEDDAAARVSFSCSNAARSVERPLRSMSIRLEAVRCQPSAGQEVAGRRRPSHRSAKAGASGHADRPPQSRTSAATGRTAIRVALVRNSITALSAFLRPRDREVRSSAAKLRATPRLMPLPPPVTKTVLLRKGVRQLLLDDHGRSRGNYFTDRTNVRQTG